MNETDRQRKIDRERDRERQREVERDRERERYGLFSFNVDLDRCFTLHQIPVVRHGCAF